jgi:bifunctional DNA-binding transcriptional regulator/antitoxin component of YhaV-PrlF toxin-antitoxin module
MVSENPRFKALLQKGNRIQTPILIRELHELEKGKTFKVRVSPDRSVYSEDIYIKFQKDGRFTIPKIIIDVLGLKPGQVVRVTIYMN